MLKAMSISSLLVLALPAVALAQQTAARTMVVTGTPHVVQTAQMPAPMPASAERGGTFRDEYGNLYNSRGDRLDRSGHIIAPPVTPPGARALR